MLPLNLQNRNQYSIAVDPAALFALRTVHQYPLLPQGTVLRLIVLLLKCQARRAGGYSICVRIFRNCVDIAEWRRIDSWPYMRDDQ
jgi:hypothetical protein